MFNKLKSLGGLGNLSKIVKDLPKIQKIIKTSLENFSKSNSKESFQKGLITIYTRGDVIKNIEMSKEYITMLGKDKKMAEDILVSSISTMTAKVKSKKMEMLKKDALDAGVSPELVSQVSDNDLLSGHI
jgi:DNA-binding protein YbaB